MGKPKLLTIVLVLLILPALFYAVTTAYQAGRKTGGEMAYHIIETNTGDFLALNTGAFRDWYEKHHDIEGVHSYTREKTTYILVCAGQKPSGGFWIKNVVLLQDKDKIRIAAVLRVPARGEIVTEAITYPHALLSIPKDRRVIVLDSLNSKINSELEEKIDSGTFLKFVKPDIVEIRISSVPEQIPPRSFRLYEEVVKDFDSLKLKEGDQVRFTYLKNINDEDVITELEKIKN